MPMKVWIAKEGVLMVVMVLIYYRPFNFIWINIIINDWFTKPIRPDSFSKNKEREVPLTWGLG